MNAPLMIDQRPIDAEQPPFIIAELSGNHNHSLDRALAIVNAAADAGVDAVKLQTYTPDTITLDISEGEFFISDKNSLWANMSLYDLYKNAHTPWEWHRAIFECAKDRNLICFSSPFDESAVDFLEGLEIPAYKIASFEITHLPLIRAAAATGKPLIISTGMATLAEIDDAVRTAKEAGCAGVALLKCTSTYPASPENSNVLSIPHLRQVFGSEVGLSDHTMGVGASIAAVAVGATIIEKHLTLSRADGGVDSAFSLEPDEMRSLVVESKRAWESLGSVKFGPCKAEVSSLGFRRSLYISVDMQAGDILTPDNLRVVRPANGLAPKYYDVLLGKSVTRTVARGTPLSWDLVGG